MEPGIDSSGRIVIPREVRRAAGLEPGMRVSFRVDDGAIIIESATTPVRTARKGRFVVAQPVVATPRLTAQTVSEVRERLRTERGSLPVSKKR